MEKKRTKRSALLYEMRIEIEELDDSDDYRYLATSPDLKNLIVVGDTVDEVLTLAPQVASALIASIKAAGDPLPKTLRARASLPSSSYILVPA